MSATPTIGRPLLVCGYPKSGTTLLLALLDGHPELTVFPEETFFLWTAVEHPQDEWMEQTLRRDPRAIVEGGVAGRGGARDYSSIDGARFAELARKNWSSSNKSARALLESTVAAWAEVGGESGRSCFVEKTPGHEYHLARAASEWPDLRALMTVRDPRENFVSYRRKRETAGRPGFALDSFVGWWANSTLHWQRFAADNPQAHTVVYERLLSDPATEMRRVAEFLGIAWSDTLVQPTRAGVPWAGNSMWGEQHDGIRPEASSRWRTDLDPKDVRFLETWLGDLMEQYGWPLEAPRASLFGRARSLFTGNGVRANLHMLRRIRAARRG